MIMAVKIQFDFNWKLVVSKSKHTIFNSICIQLNKKKPEKFMYEWVSSVLLLLACFLFFSPEKNVSFSRTFNLSNKRLFCSWMFCKEHEFKLRIRMWTKHQMWLNLIPFKCWQFIRSVEIEPGSDKHEGIGNFQAIIEYWFWSLQFEFN